MGFMWLLAKVVRSLGLVELVSALVGLSLGILPWYSAHAIGHQEKSEPDAR